jgi:MSHA pilin protein MshD
MCNSRQAGLSLIEMVVFIVVVGIALATLVLLFFQLTLSSPDPLIRKQALAIATTILEEVQLQAFTFCDPDDSNVYTATVAAGCATPEGIGAEGGETRYATPRFDNVSDYHGFTMAAGTVRTIADPTPIPGLATYSVGVTIDAIAASELSPAIPVGEALRITVTATHVPTSTAVTLQGYRLRYAPNSP